MTVERLTDESLRLLRWIDENRCTKSAWLTSSKPAKGPTEKWDQHGLYGPNGSIIVSSDAWFAALHCFGPHPDQTVNMWALTDAGRQAISQEPRHDRP